MFSEGNAKSEVTKAWLQTPFWMTLLNINTFHITKSYQTKLKDWPSGKCPVKKEARGLHIRPVRLAAASRTHCFFLRELFSVVLQIVVS